MDIGSRQTGYEQTGLTHQNYIRKPGISNIEMAILFLVLLVGVSLAYLSIETSFIYAFTAILVAIAGVVVIRNPEIGLLIVIFLFPFEDLNQVVMIGPFSVIKLMSVALFAAYAFHYFIFNPGQKLVLVPQNYYIAFLVLASLVSNLVAIDPDFAVSMTFKLLRMVGLFILVTNIVRTPESLLRVAWVMILSGLASAGYGMYEYFFRPELLQDMRVSGPLDDPIGFSYTMVILLPITWHILNQSRDFFIRLFLLGSGALFSYAIILSGTRSGIMAAGLVVILIAVRLKRPVLTFSVAGALLLVGFLLLPENVKTRLGLTSEIDRATQTSNERRMTYAIYGFNLFFENPFIGVGLGGFQESYSNSQYQHLQGAEDVRRAAHNMYVEIATGTGLLGLVPFMLLVTTPLLALERIIRNKTWSSFNSISKALQVGLVALLFVGLFSSSQYEKPLWLLLALSSAMPVIIKQAEVEAEEKIHADQQAVHKMAA